MAIHSAFTLYCINGDLVGMMVGVMDDGRWYVGKIK